MKEKNKTIEIKPLPLNSSKPENSNTSINPFIDHLQRSNLALVFSSPLIRKEKKKKISKDNILSLSSKFEPLALSVQGKSENPEIFKEKETLKKIFSNQIEKQRKFNNNLYNYLNYNTKIHYFEDFIFAPASQPEAGQGVLDKVQISNSLTTLNNEKVKKEFQIENFKKDYYQLTLNIKNYLFILDKFVRRRRMSLKFKSYIWNNTLFMTKRILDQLPKYDYRKILISEKKTYVQKVKPLINMETIAHKPKTETKVHTPKAYGENLLKNNEVVDVEKAVELKSKRNKKLLILQKKLITNLLKQGINLILYLNIFINKKQMDIKSLINLNISPALANSSSLPKLENPTCNSYGNLGLENINSIDPALLEKISNIFIETKKFKSELELELNKIKNEIFIPINPSLCPESQSRDASFLHLSPRLRRGGDNLEFKTPELTNLPFSLLFYKNNINYTPSTWSARAKGYNNLQLKTIPFSLLLNKNTALDGKNAVKLSIVTSHFDLDKNNTRDTVQTSAQTSTTSLSVGSGPGICDYVENSVHKPVISQYLKELSIYNIRNKGIIIFYYILIGFHFNTDLNKSFTISKKTKDINKLLAASFKSMYCLISKPVFISTPDKIIVQLFYYLLIPNIFKLKKYFNIDKNKNKDNKVINTYFNREPIVKNNDNMTLKSSKSQILKKSILQLRKKQKKKAIILRKIKNKKQYVKFRKIKTNVRVKLRKLSSISLIKVFPNKFKILSLILNNFFKKPIVFDLVRIHYPYNDSNILVNLLGIMINKIKLRMIIRRFFEKAIIKNINNLKENRGIIIPSFLSGLTIRVAGRLLTQKVIPRLTVKTTRRGASAQGRINFKDIATYTNKNKRGAYSITVKAGQNLF